MNRPVEHPIAVWLAVALLAILLMMGRGEPAPSKTQAANSAIISSVERTLA